MFCDIQYQDLGYYDNCYDRKDTPDQYCDKYAIDESDRWYTAEFCQGICDNYEAVIDRGEAVSTKTINYVVIGVIIATLLSSTSTVALASTGFTGDDFKAGQSQRPPINPDFDPDESCLFDVYQEQCIPGAEQECPENFGNNDDATCFPKTLADGEWKWRCPDGYHNEDGDETGQCYPNDEGCYCIEYCDENPERNVCKPDSNLNR
jgi:hypothetical protein